ncbi:MAG: aminoacetone oxidase family FAD-binding enzyme [Candidatus Falkowbacteria bacterium]|nr:MAG: aminoacetone oxidase family FAD-binding enzyme [Candidatus Falkowbacteria bacterium]
MKYDLVVIGGGPAGLMAALQAAEKGRQVLLLEKNKRLGVKLLLAGGGRCNITNNIPDYRVLAKSYGPAAKFLIPIFSRFGVSEIMDFFASRGVRLKTEADNKVFPESNLAADILGVFVRDIKAAGGIIRTECEVKDFVVQDNLIKKLILSSGEEISAARFLIATGGQSYPATGSSGDAYRWLKNLGHTIMPLYPGLAPILVNNSKVKELEGLSLNNVSLSLLAANKKLAVEQGAVIFTASGLSGPAALNLSRFLDFNQHQTFELRLDFQPEITLEDLDKLLILLFSKDNKFVKNSLEEIIPARLAVFILNTSGINENLKSKVISRSQRKKILESIKDFKLTIINFSGYDRAMVTVGGLSLEEVNAKSMSSKIISNLYLAGEVLDIAGPTGGFNLQVAWSTGFIAGSN